MFHVITKIFEKFIISCNIFKNLNPGGMGGGSRRREGGLESPRADTLKKSGTNLPGKNSRVKRAQPQYYLPANSATAPGVRG